MNREQSGSRKFGRHIVVHWRCHPVEATCEVKLLWDDALLIEKRLKRQERESRVALPFNMRREGAPLSIAGEFVLALDHAGRPLVLSLELEEHGGGKQHHQLWPEGPQPEPPEPPEPPAPGPGPTPPEPPPVPEPLATETLVTEARIGQDMDSDLFPYLYLRAWTGIGKQEREDNFIDYVPLKGGLYDKLVKAKPHGGRADMEQDAAEFATWFGPGAEGGLPQLPEWTRAFPACHSALRALHAPDAHALRREAELQLGYSWNTLRKHVRGPEFAQAMDDCWQGVLALNILLGDRRKQLDALIRIIVLGSLFSRMLLLLDAGPGEDAAGPAQDGPALSPPPEPVFWTAARIADGLAATLILPGTLFPLPAAKPAPATVAQQDSVAPYAIGDLELVRQRLKGYALGEVSRIENLMRGECQETTRRQLSRTSQSASAGATADMSNETGWSAAGSERTDSANRSLSLEFEVDSTTTYGPPTDATAKETVALKPNAGKTPQQSEIEAAAVHAQAVTSKTVARLARRVQWQRASASLDEREDSVVNRLDGSRNERNMRGIYRWVDKIYEAHVVNYGHRLMLEFRLQQPAAAFVRDQQRLGGRSLRRPRPPGVPRYTDISVKPGTDHYYVDLIAAYEAYDADLPPAASMIASMSARVGMAGSCQELAIPDGYQAARATVSANWTGKEQSVDLFGLVGTQPFAISSKDGAQAGPGGSATMVLHKESGTLPFSIALAAPAAAPDGGAAPTLAPVCVASVDIRLELTDSAFAQWQFGFYRTIQEAYQRRMRAWLEAVGAGGREAGTSALASQQLVRHALGRTMRQVLWQRASAAAGLTPRDEARYAQFFDQAFEWKEMAHSLDEAWVTGELADAGNLLSAFIEADSARVLLPVHPAYQSWIPYFLDSGMLWDGDRMLVPAMEPSVDLVYSLKQCHARRHDDPVRSPPWQIRVPTTMTVIQQGEELPTFH